MPVPLSRIVPAVARGLLAQPSLVSETRHRVRWGSVDFNGHMNYASYLEEMEAARWDWVARSGAGRAMIQHRVKPVVVGVDIRYRRELRPWARFECETRLTAVEGRISTFQQIFSRGETLHAWANITALLLRAGRVVDPATTRQVLGPFVVQPRAIDTDRHRSV